MDFRFSYAKSHLPGLHIDQVGYTNAGKSTLHAELTRTEREGRADPRLFGSLDTAAREGTLADGTRAVFVDTIGFIEKLSHGLVRCFNATLEEVTPLVDFALNPECDYRPPPAHKVDFLVDEEPVVSPGHLYLYLRSLPSSMTRRTLALGKIQPSTIEEPAHLVIPPSTFIGDEL